MSLVPLDGGRIWGGRKNTGVGNESAEGRAGSFLVRLKNRSAVQKASGFIDFLFVVAKQKIIC